MGSDEWVIHGIELAGNRVRPQRKRAAGDAMSPRALLRGQPGPNNGRTAEALMNERPYVYFVYTEDGGAQRAESHAPSSPMKQKNQRVKSAGRPNTANRKGRAVKSSAAQPTAQPMANFLHSPEPEAVDPSASAFPKARGLVTK